MSEGFFSAPEIFQFSSIDDAESVFGLANAALIKEQGGEVLHGGGRKRRTTNHPLSHSLPASTATMSSSTSLTIANASNAPKQVELGFVAGFFTSCKRVVQMVIVETKSGGKVSRVMFDEIKEGDAK